MSQLRSLILLCQISMAGHVAHTKKKALYFQECQCILHGSTNWEHHFYVSNWREARHFMMVNQATKDM